ncbi:hypothetical protein [Catenuloplanes nepalensis]|uniref:hypothetical protein n=1 Tax=Catenuloplanes nepalensis TaxID=587533 RepID=UPI0027D88B8E|nr:hypothetical protein [Catenuloplanes nepalensis]
MGRALLGFTLTILVVVLGVRAGLGERRRACEVKIPHVLVCQVFDVRGLVGSEKLSFFHDREVVAAFERLGLRVSVEAAGSRTMACTDGLTSYDFAFPGSAAAADDVMSRADGTAAPVTVFSSPLVIATYEEVARALPSGVASLDHQTFDMDRYLNDVYTPGKRWRDLRLPAPYPGFQRAVLLSTRLDSSNSAELFLALSSHVRHGGPIATKPDLSRLTEPMRELFRAQGSTGLTSDEPFDQYLSVEGYQLPMQAVYEAQFLDAARADPDGLITEVTMPDGGTRTFQRIMLYPTPSISSDHTIAPLTGEGGQVAAALTSDAELRRLAAAHGFRPAGHPEVFAAENEEHGHAVLEPPGPPVPAPAPGAWREFVSDVVEGVYGEDRAGAACA